MAKDETPLQEKQYYVLQTYKPEGWKKGQIITIPIEVAAAYLGPKILTPLKTAIAKKQYVPKIEIATKDKPEPEEEPTSSPKIVEEEKKPKKKTLVKNTLRAAVQKKKEAKEPTPEPEPTLKPEPTKEDSPEEEPTFSSSAAEDAIKAKIAAAKKKKK